MRSFRKKYRLFITLFIVFCSSVYLATAQTYSQIPFVVYNSEKVFQSSELGQEIIRRYNKIVEEQGEAAETAAVAASPSNSAGHGDKKLPHSSSSNKETSAVDEEPDPYDFNSLLGKPRPYKVGRY